MHKQEKLMVTRTKKRKQRNSVDYRIILKIEHIQILPKFREYFFLFCSFPSFILFRRSLFLKSCRDTQKLNKVTTFEICSKLNSLSCNYVNSSHQLSFFLLKTFFLSVCLVIIFLYQLTIIYSYQPRSNF